MSETEQNKTEDATPFKLKRAREKGQVARGMDLGFFAMLVALSILSVAVIPGMFTQLAEIMARTFTVAISNAGTPESTIPAIADAFLPLIQMLALFGGSVVLVTIFFEIVQLRGIVFSGHPLKPEFSRLNPGKGFQRLFSFKTIKETLKNILKMAFFAGAAFLLIRFAIDESSLAMDSAAAVVDAMRLNGQRLMFAFSVLALIVAIIDQVIARQEFKKQMRMSKSELQREHKDREGEPRQKQKRLQIHRELANQQQALGDLPGSDMLIVNPQHYAVALAYNADTMSAPTITAKGRNNFALHLKRAAAIHGVPIFAQPVLARGLYASAETGTEVPGKHFRAVADLYLALMRSRGERVERGND